MTPTFVIVPVRNEWELTRSLIWSLDAQTQRADDVLILDNGSTDYTPTGIRAMKGPHPSTRKRMRPWLHQSSQPGKTIYEMWNHGFARARRLAQREPFNVLVLNNDVELAARTIAVLAGVLRDDPHCFAAYPDCDAEWSTRGRLSLCETRGVFGDGGLFGPAFMLAGERISWTPLVTDLAYQWWYGDNHLAECIELAGGKQVRVVGLPIRHVNEATAQHYPELYAKKLFDRGQWISRHSRGFGYAPERVE